MKDKIINAILKFIIRHKRLDQALSKHKWYTELLYEQTLKTIRKIAN